MDRASVESVVRRRFLDGTGPVQDPVAQLVRLLEQEAPLLAPGEAVRWADRLAVDLVGLGPIQALLDRPDVSDVLVNGPGEVWVEAGG